ncbi:MAG: NADP-dependent phosphogluconate dehydrogenase [Thiolinea sp.]
MKKADIGLIGLGTMGSALALNIAEQGFNIAVWNRTAQVTRDFHAAAGELAGRIIPTESYAELVDALAEPRAVILMVPAGNIVDQQMAALKPLLAADDLIMDAGNANFHDTQRRMAEAGQPFLGVGVSGGAEGARHGPSIMVGGAFEHWQRVAPILTAIAARYEGEACAAWMGEGGAGHFVKMVHNGIEYADMQMIAEIYGIQRDGMGLEAVDIAAAFEHWNHGILQSYLVEITAEVARAVDGETGLPLLEVIVDAAGQKGTGRWTAIEAQHLAAPVPCIEAGVLARNLSSRRATRAEGQDLFGAAPQAMGAAAPSTSQLEQALLCGKILCYAQGFAMIRTAAEQFGWQLDLPTIARTWRAGCIIRSRLLDDMATALAEAPERNLMFAPFFAQHLREGQAELRAVVSTATAHGIPVPALAAGLFYFDTLRTARGTANLIQGQRDYFGWHGFERSDGRTDQHGPWVPASV